LLQIVALLAMEPPSSAGAGALADEKVKVFRQIRTLRRDDVVRGQYRGYQDEAGVEGGSDTETYVAARLCIESWRWAGVPWLVRTGKSLPVTATEAVIEFKSPPRLLFADTDVVPQPNRLRFRLGADDGVTLQMHAKAPGEELVTSPVDLEIDYERVFGERQEAYERLLGDAMEGDPRRFGRADSLDEQWRIVDDVLQHHNPVSLYYRGTWGPAEGDALAAPWGGWQEPLDAG
jgi:glucose-6-phosphate 1-dehydrogenase